MINVTEIAPQVFRLSTYIPDFDLQFNQFLVVDDEPLLVHTGLRKMFPAVRDAVARILPPAKLRWIAFSHFEQDECGALNEWLGLAPHAEPACSFVGKMVSVDDFADRPARALQDDEVFSTGAKRFRFLQTPHVPHAWDAGILFEESTRTLFCSDLFHHAGDPEPQTEQDVVERSRDALRGYQGTPMDHYLPWGPRTDATLQRLAGLEPGRCAAMHGATFVGDGSQALKDLARMFRDELGGVG